MYDKDDHFTRSVHGICAIPCLLVMLACLSMLAQLAYLSHNGAMEASGLAASGYLTVRLLWYALTGRNCLNRDRIGLSDD